AAQQAPEFPPPRVGAGGELAHLLLVPPGPADLGGIRALARGRHHAPVDEQEIAVGVKAELRLHPGAALGRDVLVPHQRRLHDVAVAVEHRELLARARGHRRASLLLSLCETSDAASYITGQVLTVDAGL